MGLLQHGEASLDQEKEARTAVFAGWFADIKVGH